VVVIDRTVPNPQRPEYRHVVFSRLTGKWFQLRDEDLEAPQYMPPQATDPPQHFAPGDAFQQGVIPSGPQAQYTSPSDAFGQSYGPPHAYHPPQTMAKSVSRKDETRLMWFSGGIAGLGLLIIITTFLPWLSLMGIHIGSGWNAMLHGSGGGGFSIFVHGEGVLFFTGFWSIVVGLAVITGGVLLFMRYTVGSWVAWIAGGIGVLFSVLSILTVVTHSLSAGIGLWLFNLLSVVAVVVSVMSIKAFR
jgi:hypothetical protein